MNYFFKNKTIFIFALLCLFYFLASINQYYYPLVRMEGDSFGSTTFNYFYISSIILLYFGSLSIGISNLFNSKFDTKSLIIFITSILFTIFLVNVGSASILILLLILISTITGFVAILNKQTWSSMILFTPCLFVLGFIFAGSIFQIFGFYKYPLWLPEMIITNIINLAILGGLFYFRKDKEFLVDKK